MACDPTLLPVDNAAPLLGAVICAMVVAAFEGLKQLWDARERLAGAERDALARDQALAEGKLRELPAQMEPLPLQHAGQCHRGILRLREASSQRLVTEVFGGPAL